MNQQQLKHVISRLQEARRSFEEKIRTNPKNPGKSIDTSERIELIKTGKVPLKEKIKPSAYYIGDVFDFSQFEEPNSTATEIKELNDEYNKIKDELILGDNTKALELLNKFLAWPNVETN